MSLIYGYWQNIEPKIHKDFYIISCLCVINCFKYFIINTLGQNVKKKSGKKNFEPNQVFMHNFVCLNNEIFTKIFELCQVNVAKYFNTSKFYTSDAHYSIKTGSITFSSSFDMQQFHHLLRNHATSINSSFNSFLSALLFSSLICQAKSLI